MLNIINGGDKASATKQVFCTTMYLAILSFLLVAVIASTDMSFSDIQSPIDVLLYRAAMAESQKVTPGTISSSIHRDYGVGKNKYKYSKGDDDDVDDDDGDGGNYEDTRCCQTLLLLFISDFFEIGNGHLFPVFDADAFHPSILEDFDDDSYEFGDDAPFVGFFSLDYRPDIMAMTEFGCLISEGGFLLDLTRDDVAPFPSMPYETQIFTKGYVCVSSGFDGSGNRANRITYRDAIIGGFGGRGYSYPTGTVSFTPLPTRGPVADYCKQEVEGTCFMNTLHVCGIPTCPPKPTVMPTRSPNTRPSVSPSASPSASPTSSPSASPTGSPSASPTEVCTIEIVTECFIDGQPCSRVDPDTFVTPCEGRPTEALMKFTGGSCENSDNIQGEKFTCTDFNGGPPSRDGDPAYIVATDAKGADVVYFDGTVEVGDYFRLSDDGDRFEADQVVTIFTDESQNTVLQQVQYHSSCSQNLFLMDRFGSLQLVGFFNEDQGNITSFFDAEFPLTIETLEQEDDVVIETVNVLTIFEGERDSTLEDLDIVLVPGSILVYTVTVSDVDLSSPASFELMSQVTGTRNPDGAACEATDTESFDVGVTSMPP